MNRIVLDASAILAVLHNETGSERLTTDLLSHAIGSTVNLAEAQAKLVRDGGDPDEAWEDTLSAVAEVSSFTDQHARIAGALVAQTRSLGLSLGDRACLALGIALKAPVYTTDKSWKNLNVGVRIHVIR